MNNNIVMFINKCLILLIGNDFIVGAAGERIDNYIKECTDYITYYSHDYHQLHV